MEHYTCHSVLFCQVARWSRTDRAAIQDYSIGGYVYHLSEIQVDCLDIVIEALLRWNLSVCFSKSGVFIHDSIDVHLFEKKGMEPMLDDVDVLGVPVRKDHGVLGLAVDPEDLELGA